MMFFFETLFCKWIPVENVDESKRKEEEEARYNNFVKKRTQTVDGEKKVSKIERERTDTVYIHIL